MQCTCCGSDHTRAFRIVHEEGTSTGGEYKSKLAARCSPPWLDSEIATPYLWAAGIVSAAAAYGSWRFIGGWQWSAGASGLIFGAAIVTWNMTVAKSRLARYYADLNAWKHSWVCMKCGETFVVK